MAIIIPFAAMAELVDALDSGSSRGNLVDVRVILAARPLAQLALPGKILDFPDF
jgi:hypothetical protein